VECVRLADALELGCAPVLHSIGKPDALHALRALRCRLVFIVSRQLKWLSFVVAALLPVFIRGSILASFGFFVVITFIRLKDFV
jgi:hypothetical protein